MRYWQGFEIDGSDTSYNLLTPEREQALEIVLWYLAAKTIDKDADLEVKASGRQGDKRQARLSAGQHWQLRDLLADPDVWTCEIRYVYVSPNRLYPEVKRYIIDLMSQIDGSATQYVDPVFEDESGRGEYLTVAFGNPAAKGIYNCADDVSNQDYVLQVMQADYCAIEVNCSLGAPYGSALYNLKRVADRFPELMIDVKASGQEMLAHYLMSGKAIWERITLNALDPVDLLTRMLAVPETYVYHNYFNYQKRKLEPGRLAPVYLQGFRKPLYRYVSHDPQQDAQWDRQLAVWETISKIAGNQTSLTPGEYVRYAEKLTAVTLLTDQEFTSYTTVFLQMAVAGKPTQVVLKCFRRPGEKGFRMVLDVPGKLRRQVERQYGI